MKILVLQETDWLTRGPHTQHHLFERLTQSAHFEVFVLDFDIDNKLQNSPLIARECVYDNYSKVLDNSKIKVIRTIHLHVPYLRRITSLISNSFRILKLFRNSRPDIIIAFSITNGFIGLVLSRIFRIPFVFFYIDILHELVPHQYLKSIARIIAKFNIKHSERILAHTHYQKEFLIQEGGDKKRIEVIPDGIDLKNTIPNKAVVQNLKKQFNINNKDFVLFFMGFLYHFAGLEEIVEYYNEKIKSGAINFKFIILGDGGIYSDLKKYVKENDANWVILPGRVSFSEITEYIELADLCLLSFEINNITKDILPIKILEYMGMKKAVLSTALPGVVNELGNSNGIIFSKSQEDLIKKIEEFYYKKEELHIIGEKGYNFVKENYIWDNIVKDFKRFLLTILKQYYKEHN